MKRFLTLLKIEGRFSLRCPDTLIFGVGMPVGVLFLISMVAGNQSASDQGYTLIGIKRS